MAGPTFAQEKKPLSVVPVPQKKEADEVIQQLRSLERDFGYGLKLRMDNARLAGGGWFEAWKIRGAKPDFKDDEFMNLLMRQGLGAERPVVAYLNQLFKAADALHKRIEALGTDRFVSEPSYLNLYIGLVPKWKGILIDAKEDYEDWQRRQKPGSHATIEEPARSAMPYWKRPAVELPRSGTDLAIAPGERVYMGEGGRAVPESVLRVERELERKRMDALGEGRGFVLKMDYDTFFKQFVPVLPFLDAAIKDIRLISKGDTGRYGQRVASLVLNLTMAGVDVVIIGQVSTRTAARVTGTELASSMLKPSGRYALGRLERDVFETALRELEPGEVKDLFRLARSAKGGGTGWFKILEDLAGRAGNKEITGDLIRAYLKEQAGEGSRRVAWRMKAGTVDFFSNGLSFFGRERFRQRVAAEFFNELRMSTDFKATKALLDGMRAAPLTKGQQIVASDAIFYAVTSFSKKSQRALLSLAEKKGWPALTNDLMRATVDARRAGVADPFGAGIRSGLAKVLPEYAQAFRAAPARRLMEFGIFTASGPFIMEGIAAIAHGVSWSGDKLYTTIAKAYRKAFPKQVPITSEEEARNAFRGAMERWRGEKY